MTVPSSCADIHTSPEGAGASRDRRRGRGRSRGAIVAAPALLVLLLLSARPASAGPKTDVVTLNNGNTLTCEIKLLETGRLQASTDDLGTVSIEWDKVRSVSAPRFFRVETSTGQRIFGRLVSTTPGMLDVEGPGVSMQVAIRSVVYLTPIKSGFWRRLDGSLDLGLSYTQSSGVAQYSLNSSATYRLRRSEFTVSGSSNFTHQKDADNTSRHNLDFASIFLLSDNWLWLAGVRADWNQELGYLVRGTVSAGAGRFLVRSNRAVFVVGGGLSTNREVPIDGPSVQNLDALVSVQQSFFTYDYPKTDVGFTADVYPGLSQPGRVRIEVDARLKREIIRDFTVGLTAYNSYDNKPPSETAATNDVGLSLTIGWTF